MVSSEESNIAMDKHTRETRRREEDIALNRALIWVGGAILLELLLILVNKYYIHYRTTAESISLAYAFDSVLRALRMITPLAALGGLIWSIREFLKSGCVRARAIVLFVVSSALFITVHMVLSFQEGGVRMLFLLVPAWAALALVYYLYQREFFYSALYTGMGAVGLWLLRHRGASGRSVPLTAYGFLVLMAVMLVAGLVALNQMKKSGGVLKLGGREIQALPADANYTFILLSFAVNVAALVLAFALGETVAYYLIYLLVAWLFALLVYYTVKMV